VPVFAEPDLGMFSIFGQTEASQKEGAHRPQQRDIFWPVTASLWRVAILMRCSTTISIIKYYNTSEFRKPYLKSGNSSNTAYSCNAEFMVSFCTLLSEKLCEASHFYGPATGA